MFEKTKAGVRNKQQSVSLKKRWCNKNHNHNFVLVDTTGEEEGEIIEEREKMQV